MAESTSPQPPTSTNPAPAAGQPRTGAETQNQNETDQKASVNGSLPRVAIKYCTQCQWMLRAAYFAQELLSTFSASIGEIALIPATGGIFTVTITTLPSPSQTSSPSAEPHETLLWDRKRDGGFPETKQLKALVRNIIDPARDLGHVDRALRKKGEAEGGGGGEGEGKKKSEKPEGAACEDCK